MSEQTAPKRLLRCTELSGSWVCRGMLVTVPVPAEAELPRDRMDAAITQALEEAETRGVSGRELTPFLLTRVSTLTGEDSLRANLALLDNNARVGAQIAVALARS